MTTSKKTTTDRPTSRRRTSPFVLFTLLGVLAVAAGVFALRQYTALSFLLAYLLAVNVVTFLLYLYDKTIAGWQVLRVPERVLHLFELVGGSPFAFLAQRVLRHKTAKTSYRVVFWLLCGVQAALIVWAAIYWKR